MKKIFDTLNNTYKALQLLSNPEIMELLSKEAGNKKTSSSINHANRLGRGDVYFHKYFMIQVVN